MLTLLALGAANPGHHEPPHHDSGMHHEPKHHEPHHDSGMPHEPHHHEPHHDSGMPHYEEGCGPDGCEGDDNGPNHPPPPVCLLPCIPHGERRREEWTPEMMCGFLDNLYAEDKCVNDCDENESAMIGAFMDVGCVMEDFQPPAAFDYDSGYFEEFAEETYGEFNHPDMYMDSGYYGNYDYGYDTAAYHDSGMPAKKGDHMPHYDSGMMPPMDSGFDYGNYDYGYDTAMYYDSGMPKYDSGYDTAAYHDSGMPHYDSGMMPPMKGDHMPHYDSGMPAMDYGMYDSGMPSYDTAAHYDSGMPAADYGMYDSGMPAYDTAAHYDSGMPATDYGMYDSGMPTHYDSGMPAMDYGTYGSGMPPMKRKGDHMPEEGSGCGPDGCPGDDNGPNHPPPPVCLLPCIPQHRRREEMTPAMICGFLDQLYAEDKCVNDCDEMETSRITAFMDVGCVFEDFEDPAEKYFDEELMHEFEEPEMYMDSGFHEPAAMAPPARKHKHNRHH